MRKTTIGTLFNPSAIHFDISIVSRTMFPAIQRAVTEQTVQLLTACVARVIFTLTVLKIT